MHTHNPLIAGFADEVAEDLAGPLPLVAPDSQVAVEEYTAAEAAAAAENALLSPVRAARAARAASKGSEDSVESPHLRAVVRVEEALAASSGRPEADPVSLLATRARAPSVPAALDAAAVTFDNEADPKFTVLSLRCKDRRGLLFSVCDTLGMFGVAIHKADCQTEEDGTVVDVLWVSDGSRRKIELDDRLDAIRAAVQNAVVDELAGAASVLSSFTALEISGRNRTGLLHDILSALAEHGVLVHNAKISCTPDGFVSDVLWVQKKCGDDVQRSEYAVLIEALRDAINDPRATVTLKPPMRELADRSSPSNRVENDTLELLSFAHSENCFPHEAVGDGSVPLSVDIRNDVSPDSTVIDVHCDDRTGLVFDLARSLSSMGLMIKRARIHPDPLNNQQVTDSFFVTDAVGRKILGEDRIDKIRDRVKATCTANFLHLDATTLLDSRMAVLQVCGKERSSQDGLEDPGLLLSTMFCIRQKGLDVAHARISRHGDWCSTLFLIDSRGRTDTHATLETLRGDILELSRRQRVHMSADSMFLRGGRPCFVTSLTVLD